LTPARMGADLLAEGRAESPGAATIVNAMATGRGAAFAIGLKVTATVRLIDGGGISGTAGAEGREDPLLIEECVRRMLKLFDCGYGAEIETESNLPVARGLSSSSAASNAAVLATAAALEKLGYDVPDDERLIDLGIDSSIECGVTVTGAFDDASASYFGGAVVTDNTSREILRKEDMPSLEVVILCPHAKSYSGRADVDAMKLLAPQVEIAHREACEGDLLKAMTLNGLIYCASIGFEPRPALAALEAGAMASGLSGKGPAFVAVTEDGRSVAESWAEFEGDVIITETSNTGSKVLR